MKRLCIVCVTALALAACGNNNNDNNTNADTGANNGADTGGQNNGADTGGQNNGADMGSQNNGADMGGTNGTDMGPDIAVNGCRRENSMDMTGMAAVNITTDSAWMVGHHACIIVSTGTVVTWDGVSATHPLVGGETPTSDPTSPITVAANGAMGSVDVTFDTAGVYPYFCAVHLSAMQGVVYVQD